AFLAVDCGRQATLLEPATGRLGEGGARQRRELAGSSRMLDHAVEPATGRPAHRPGAGAAQRRAPGDAGQVRATALVSSASFDFGQIPRNLVSVAEQRRYKGCESAAGNPDPAPRPITATGSGYRRDPAVAVSGGEPAE